MMMTTEAMTPEGIAQLIRAGRHEEARERLDDIQVREEDRADVTFLRGYLQESAFDREGALATYRQVLELAPQHVEASFHAALLTDQLGDTQEAIKLCRRCMTASPVHVNALLNLAVLYEEVGELGSAESCVRTVLEAYPEHPRAHQLLKSVLSTCTLMYDEHSHSERERRSAVLDLPISDFELSVRSRNCLRQMNIRTLGDLLRTTEAELLSYKNFGETSLNEVKAMLSHKGLSLGQALHQPERPAVAPPPAESPGGASHLNRSIADLELSVRSRKALQRLGVTTLEDLAMRSEGELLAIRNFGQTSLTEIKEQLARFGLSLSE